MMFFAKTVITFVAGFYSIFCTTFRFTPLFSMPYYQRRMRTGRKVRRTKVRHAVRKPTLYRRAKTAIRAMKQGKDTSFWNWHVNYQTSTFTWGTNAETDAYVEPLQSIYSDPRFAAFITPTHNEWRLLSYEVKLHLLNYNY